MRDAFSRAWAFLGIWFKAGEVLGNAVLTTCHLVDDEATELRASQSRNRAARIAADTAAVKRTARKKTAKKA